MDTLLQDLRFAARTLWRRPAFSVGALATLALGVAATTAIFSVVQAIVLRPLPYPDPDRIAIVETDWLKSGDHGPVSAPDFHDLHDQNRTFEALAYFQGFETAIGVGDTADYAMVLRATREFFPALGFTPQLGRLLSEDEQREGGPATAVVTDAFWRRQLGGDPRAVGSTLTVGQRAHEIVGVLRPGQRFPATADVYLSSASRPENPNRGGHNYRVIGRLRPAVTVAQAQDDVAAIATRLERRYPKTNEAKSFAVASLQDAVVGDVRLTLYVLLAAVGFVLLIACANVANLLLTRATARSREMVVRAAVGAARSRLIQQLLTESAVLGLLAGALALALARLGVTGLIALAPENLPRLDEVTVDAGVLMFTLAVSFGASLLFGLAPALQLAGTPLADGLKSGNKGAIGDRGAWLRSAFVMSEVAFAVVLVTGAVMLGRSLASLAAVNPGYASERVLALRTSVPTAGPRDAARAVAFYRDLLPEVRAIAGVTAAGATMAPPTILASNGGYTVEGRPPGGINGPSAVFSVVTPDYFRAMRIPLIRGREFSDADRLDAPFVTIISEALARAAFPGQDPIGRRIQCGFDSPEFMTIVGVVGDVRTGGPAGPPQPEIYMPFEQHQLPSTALTLMVRADTADPDAIGATIARLVRQRNPQVPVRVRQMGDLVSTVTATPRFRTYLLVTFAAVALVLASAGIFGVVMFGVSQRIPEIGVRVALGAAPRDVLALVMRHGLRLTVGGLAIGLLMSLALARLVAGLLFGVTATDPTTFVAVAAVIGAAALLASYLPALVASRISPMSALRTD